MTKSLLALVLVSAMLLSSVQSATIDSYCEAPNTLAVAATDSGSAPTFDHVGTYLDANKESSPLIVTNGDGTNPYKWNSYKKDGTLET